MGWFDDNAPEQQDWFTTNAPTATPTAVADSGGEGQGFLAKINAALRKPSPEVLQAPEAAVRELVSGMVPHDIPSYLESIYPPAAAARLGANVAEGDISGLPFVGRVPEIMQAEETQAGSKERYLAAMKTLMDVGMLAGAGAERAPEPLRAEPLVPPELPPSPSLGPGTIAGDVSRALERRFELQPTPPEAPPQLAPAPPIEQTLPKIGQPLPFNPEFGPQPQPDFQMPLQTETAAMPNVAELIKEKQKLEAHANVSKTIGQQVAPVVEQKLAQINESLGVPPETPPTPTSGAALSAPEPYTPEAAAVREAQPEETGISKAAIAEQREARELPAIERQKQIDFGESLDRAKATLATDPMAGQRLVEELSARPRSVDPEDTPLLIERMQQVQREFDAANRTVNEATPEQLEAAKVRLEHARAEYNKTVTATQNATSRTGAGLNSVKMILNEDYSMARMESRKRAANNGTISEKQFKDTAALHSKIAEASNGLDGLEQMIREGKQGAKSGKRFTDFMDEQAQKARERLIAKRGRLNAGIDPTNLVDEAIIGASHIAKGLTRFADWSAQMVRDFGDRIKPFLEHLWERARMYHQATSKAYRSPEKIRLERYKTRMAKDTAGVTAKIQRGDFTKTQRKPLALDPAAFKMRANLQKLKNEFERGVAKDAYNNMSPGDKFWQHFVGVERAMKLSSPGVFEKLGLAAAVREVLAPVEAAGGYAVSKVFPKLAEGTRYGAGLRAVTRAEIKAKASLFSEGMKDAWENLKGKETGLEAVSDKYGRQPDFWYNRIGKIHAAVKAPIKRAEFIRSLEHRMDAAVKAGEDINHPAVMDRLATESALDANRAIFQQNTVVSNFFSMLDRLHPAGGRAARFLFPVVKIPVNLFKEFVTYNVGGPVAAARIGHAYWRGIETLEPVAREAIIRQLVKGSAGGAAILWGYYNSDKVHDFFASVPKSFEHTPIAMAIHEGSLIKRLEEQGTGTYYKPSEAQKEAAFAAKSSIPFMYTLTDAMDAITKPGGAEKWFYTMIHSTVVPQAVSWTARQLDKPTPFSFDKTTYRPPTNIVEAITQGIPGLREDIPEYHPKREKKMKYNTHY